MRPSGIEFEVRDDETVFEAAARHGIRWPTVCGGLGSCTTCYVLIADGHDNVSEVSRFEQEGLSRIDLPVGEMSEVRLACQLRISGDVSVVRSGVRPRRKS